MTDSTKAFVNWNNALYDFFFPQNLEEDEEVSLFIDSELINEIGQQHPGLGCYDDFLRSILLPANERRSVYMELRQLYGLKIELTSEQKRKYKSNNLFDFATIYIDDDFYSSLGFPLYLCYLVFVVLMGCECYRLERRDIGEYITERLREKFPNHTSRRDSLDSLFNALADKYPQFHAERLTDLRFIGLIKYQLVLSKTQESMLKKAMYCADLSDELPYEMWALKLRDYSEASVRELLDRSLNDRIFRQRFSSLRSSFDPILYGQAHRNEEVISQGKFVLAVYEDEYTADNDRLVLLTDVNNKTISYNGFLIEKGGIDRLGEYAQYNINHVLIDNTDKAEMRQYYLQSPSDRIASEKLGRIVTFSRQSSCYLIQTQYPRRGKETYILVKTGCRDWETWLEDHGSPQVRLEENRTRVSQVFGQGWDLYYSNEIEGSSTNINPRDKEPSIVMDGGIKCLGMNNVYLFNALPYFKFPEPIVIGRLKIDLKIDDEEIDKSKYTTRIVEGDKIIIDLRELSISNCSLDVSVNLDYTNIDRRHQHFDGKFAVIGQDVSFNEEDLFSINMWGCIRSEGEDVPYMKGFQLFNGNGVQLPLDVLPYQNMEWNKGIDIFDSHFYLVNLFTANCSMRKSFSATEKQLEKCVRYAATRFDVDIKANGSFFQEIKYMLINNGFINADFENSRYQPIPPTFVQSSLEMNRGRKLFMLIGSYTIKFLYNLKEYCKVNNILLFQHSVNYQKGTSLLMPPVILLGDNFKPDQFKAQTESQYYTIPNVDIAISIFRSLPSYEKYAETLCPVPANIFAAQLTVPNDLDFPRVRESRARGYGATRWIESENQVYNKITIRDTAWADLYCLYKKKSHFCTKDRSSLLFPLYLHLPVMMQRAFYMTNLGIPKKEKAFICFNNTGENCLNTIKRYEIKDTSLTRMSHIIKVLTGKEDKVDNPSLRQITSCPKYRLFLWKNNNKHSDNPRSLLVMKDRENSICGFAILGGKDTRVFFNTGVMNDKFRLVDGNDVNVLFSKYMTSKETWQQLGISFREEFQSLPTQDEYDAEEITII